VLDLGSGAGFDCFLAAKAVGERDPAGNRLDSDPRDGQEGLENAQKRGAIATWSSGWATSSTCP